MSRADAEAYTRLLATEEASLSDSSGGACRAALRVAETAPAGNVIVFIVCDRGDESTCLSPHFQPEGVFVEPQTQIEIEAAAFRRLVEHLRTHTEVQNIDLMILADFCRNCLSKWYRAAAEERGEELDYEAAEKSLRNALRGMEGELSDTCHARTAGGPDATRWYYRIDPVDASSTQQIRIKADDEGKCNAG